MREGFRRRDSVLEFRARIDQRFQPRQRRSRFQSSHRGDMLKKYHTFEAANAIGASLAG